MYGVCRLAAVGITGYELPNCRVLIVVNRHAGSHRRAAFAFFSKSKPDPIARIYQVIPVNSQRLFWFRPNFKSRDQQVHLSIGIEIICDNIRAAAKAGMLGLMRTAALECAPLKIRVNTVNPGLIDTEMADRLAAGAGMRKDDFAALHPIGRVGQVAEVAETVLWLCSSRASFVTGHSLLVDGGFTAR
jgi:NAD(P)-dependent dehydrogenase (short-subunit alcohol dehydrogenase family)